MPSVPVEDVGAPPLVLTFAVDGLVLLAVNSPLVVPLPLVLLAAKPLVVVPLVAVVPLAAGKPAVVAPLPVAVAVPFTPLPVALVTEPVELPFSAGLVVGASELQATGMSGKPGAKLRQTC